MYTRSQKLKVLRSQVCHQRRSVAGVGPDHSLQLLPSDRLGGSRVEEVAEEMPGLFAAQLAGKLRAELFPLLACKHGGVLLNSTIEVCDAAA
ncbi:hypothetical protein MTO96_039045 [Rhipicephalus appendiculatus]